MRGMTNAPQQSDAGVVASKGTFVLKENGALALENQLAEVDPDSGELDGYASERFVEEKVEEKVEEHANNKENPHGVTKTQVGLGNVPNVATNNQTPTFSQASTLANIASGEKLSVILGKVMKGMADLISHLSNKNNPHGVTTITGNAGSATKLATARTIRTNLASTKTASFDGSGNVTPGVTGVLPVANGGTGVNNLSALASALGASKVVTGTYTGNSTANRTISLGFTPKAVLVFNHRGQTSESGTLSSYYGGLALSGYNTSIYGNSSVGVTSWDDSASILGIVNNGFKVNTTSASNSGGNDQVSSNKTNLLYYYLAFA